MSMSVETNAQNPLSFRFTRSQEHPENITLEGLPEDVVPLEVVQWGNSFFVLVKPKENTAYSPDDFFNPRHHRLFFVTPTETRELPVPLVQQAASHTGLLTIVNGLLREEDKKREYVQLILSSDFKVAPIISYNGVSIEGKRWKAV